MRSNPDTVEIGTAGTEALPTVDWEPCAEFGADPAEPGVCAGCGWLEDDHTVEVPRAA